MLSVDLQNGAYTYVFMSPEAAISGKELWSSDIYQQRTCLLAFDEGHCISKW